MTTAFSIERKVRFSDSGGDAQVAIPEYFLMFQDLVEEWFTNQLGHDYRRIFQQLSIGLGTVKTDCSFLKPAKWGDALTATLLVSHIGRSSLTLKFIVENSGEISVICDHVLIAMHVTALRPTEIPRDIKDAIIAYKQRCDLQTI